MIKKQNILFSSIFIISILTVSCTSTRYYGINTTDLKTQLTGNILVKPKNTGFYDTGDSLVGLFQEHWQPSGKNRGDPWDHKLDSTAAHGGTIFWKLNDTYKKATGSKEFRR